MILFAEHEFRRKKSTGDGATQGEHSEVADKILAKQGKKIAITAKVPRCPPGIIYLWELFQELVLGLSNSMGPQIVTWQDLKCWTGEMGYRLDPWEKLVLIRLGHLRAVINS